MCHGGFQIERKVTNGIVLHRAEVWTGTDYHFLIMKNGAIVPLLPMEEKGAHAVEYNGTTVAIAVFGDFAALEPGQNNAPTTQQLASCVLLMQLINARYGGKLWACGHSQLGLKGTTVPLKLTYGHTCPGENFPLTDVIAESGLIALYK